jgi:hypothetical protein
MEVKNGRRSTTDNHRNSSFYNGGRGIKITTRFIICDGTGGVKKALGRKKLSLLAR